MIHDDDDDDDDDDDLNNRTTVLFDIADPGNPRKENFQNFAAMQWSFHKVADIHHDIAATQQQQHASER